MICPQDLIQMHQKAKIGDGETTDSTYATWDLKQCPVCGREVIEFYAAIVVNNAEEARVIGGMLTAQATDRP